ncbi:MAG: MBL fold metallo-hydrolase [Chthoniobacterales bacterium]|nr:MBL fold metallo-hydrolase [Chthoniobacterales bacterium]
MNQFKTFTGGPLDTNAYFLESSAGNILFDAPEGAAEHFAGEKVDWLLLTHGHFDHTADAAAIQRRHGCQVAYHPDTSSMTTDRNFFRRLGFELEIEPFAADRLLEECDACEMAGQKMRILLVPGHCPGSLCFYFPDRLELIGGDVLFREGVGRWDLPGGDGPLLFTGIQKKLFSLDPRTVVFPGHGPTTTIGHEVAHNPYVGS